MKITKTSPKRLSPPPAPVKTHIENINSCTDADLPALLNSVKDWVHPKSDLYHWITILNRFDAILGSLVTKYDFKNIQSVELVDSSDNVGVNDRALLISILRFTKFLWDHCTNRNLYNSYEQLCELLYSRDLEVLEWTLRLLLKPAQRSAQRSVRNMLQAATQRILTLSQTWHTKEHGLHLAQLANENLDASEIPLECTTVTFQFYRISSDKSAENLKSEDIDEEKEKIGDGLVLINLPNANSTGKSVLQIYKELVSTYAVPEDQRFALYHRIRIAVGITDTQTRIQLVKVRLLALSMLVNMSTEEVVNTKLLLYEPDLILKLADILQAESRAPLKVKSLAFCALENFGRIRSQQNQVLNSVNASINHGTLMYWVRKVVGDMDKPATEEQQEFIDYLFGFLNLMIMSQSGVSMITSAGIIPCFIRALSIKEDHQLKNITRCVGILDSIIYGFNTAFTLFSGADGVETLILRIQQEVDFAIANLTKSDEQMDVGNSDSSSSARVEISNLRASFLRAMLKIMLHLMQTVGTADRMRNLIDTQLPSSIDKIFKHARMFTANVFGLAVNIMSTFIHNEPTSLTILQDAKLPDSFLDAVCRDIPISTEVISALPNAFGAICLNQPGLDLFNQYKPMDRFLEVFTSEEHLRNFSDADIPPLIGSSVDELIRHHPTLKDDVLSSIMKMLRKIIDLGSVVPEEDKEVCCIIPVSNKTSENMEVETGKEVKETKISQFIDVAVRFLDGIFQNTAHCKDFIKNGGVELLLKFYSLPSISYDFSSTMTFSAMSLLFRSVFEVNSTQVVAIMVKEIKSSLHRASDKLINISEPESTFAKYIDIQESNEELLKEANENFRKLVYLSGISGLLCDVFGSQSANSKGITQISQMFSDPELLGILGQLQRVMLYESIALKASTPKEWYSNKAPAATIFSGLDTMLIAEDPLSLNLLDGTSANAGASSTQTPSQTSESKGTENEQPKPDPNDVRVKNLDQFIHMMTHIPSVLTQLFQTNIKILTSRRIVDPVQKKNAQLIVESMAKLYKESLNWKRVEKCDKPVIKYCYLMNVLKHLSLMITDERTASYLQIVLVVSFLKAGGMDSLLNTIEDIWTQTVKISNDEVAKLELSSILLKCLEISLSIFNCCTNNRGYAETPACSLIRKDGEQLDLCDQLVQMRTTILAFVQKLWATPGIEKMSLPVIKELLTIILQILKAEGEYNDRPEVAAPSLASFSNGLTGMIASIFGRGVTTADETAVAQLVDMGFPRAAAETALIRSGNQVNRAAEYLITHPDVVAQATYRAATSTSTAEQPASITAATSSTAPATASSNANAESSTSNAPEASGSSSEPPQESTNTPVTPVAASSEIPADNYSPMETDATNPMETDTDDNEDAEDDEDDELAQALALSMAQATEPAVEPMVTDEAVPIEQPDGGAQPFETGVEPVEDAVVADGEDDESDDDDDENNDDEDDQDDDEEAAQEDTKMTNAETEAEASKKKEEAKELAKEQAKLRRDALDDMRKAVKTNIVESALKFMDIHEDLIFTIKDLICFIYKDDMSKAVNLILQDIRNADNIEKDKQSSVRVQIGRRYRLLAIITNDSTLQEATLKIIHPSISDIMHSVSKELESYSLGNSQLSDINALASIILVLESYISVATEPQVHTLKKFDFNINTTAGTSADSAKPDSNTLISEKSLGKRRVTDSDSLSMAKEDSESFLRISVQILAINRIDQVLLHSVLRVLVRLTRYHELAELFLSLNGLPLLYMPDRMGLFPSQQRLTLMITRHIIEDYQTIENILEQDIANWFSFSRAPSEQISAFVRNSSHLACRNPELFVKAAAKTCELTKVDMAPGKGTLIRFKRKSADSSEENMKIEDPKPSAITEAVVSYLVNEIMSLKSKEPIEDKESSMLLHLRRCFLLQSLTELVMSYPSCKILTLTCVVDGDRGKDVEISGKNVFLSHLLKDLLPNIPINALADENITDASLKQRIMEFTLSSGVVGALCLGYYATLEEENKHYPVLSKIRAAVIDSIYRCTKDAIKSSEVTTDVRYGTFLALSDMIHKILTASHSQNLRSMTGLQKSDIGNSIAKMMIERDFVGLLTSILAEIDIHHPGARSLISIVLKPLDFLAQMSVKLSRNAAVSGETIKIEKDADSPSALEKLSNVEPSTETAATEPVPPLSAGVLDEENMLHLADTSMVVSELGAGDETNNELSDIYRHSSLGILDPRMSTNMDGEVETEDEESYDSYDEDMSEEDDDEEYDEESEDDEMVLMGSGPYHGAEMEEMTDSEEEEDEDEEGEDEAEAADEGGDAGMWEDIEDDNDDDNIIEGEVVEEVEEEAEEEDEEEGMDQEDSDNDIQEEYEEIVEEQLRDGDIFEGTNDGEEEEIIVPMGGGGNRFRSRGRRAGRGAAAMEVGMGQDGIEIRFTDDPARLNGILTADPLRVPTFTNTQRDDGTHPLLQTRPSSSSTSIPGSGVADILAGPGGLVGRPRMTGRTQSRLNPIEDYLAILNGIFGGNNPRDIFETIPQRNGNGTNMIVETTGLITPRPHALNTEMGSSGNDQNIKQESPENERLLTVLSFSPHTTAKRWQEEAHLMYGKVVAEKASRVIEPILNELVPIAIDEDKKKKEQEEAEKKAKEEEERKKKVAEEEEARKKKLEEEAAAATVETTESSKDDSKMEVDPTSVSDNSTSSENMEIDKAVTTPKEASSDSSEQSGSTSAEQPTTNAPAESSASTSQEQPVTERVVVMINGAEVDITGFGIDPTFLEALPDDMRQEVLSQHVREQRRLQQQTGVAEISTDFLEALPADIRDEVLAQERREAERRNRAERQTTQAAPAELDNASFLATLDEQLRREVLMEQTDALISGLPPNLVAEANALRQRVNRINLRSLVDGSSRQRPTAGDLNEQASGALAFNAKKPIKFDSVQLVDKTSLMTLIRFLFVPEPIGKELIQKLLSNLCENHRTRIELISLILSILSDGSADLGAVDRSFSMLSLKGKNKTGQPPTTPKKQTPSPSSSLPTMMESIPNVVATRCLETLSHLLKSNTHIVQCFLVESESFSQIFYKQARASARKNKGKEKYVPGSKFPYVVLLGLLERSSFLSDSGLMELLMSVLAILSRPLGHLINKKNAQQSKPPTDTSTQTSTEPAVATQAETTSSSNADPTVEPNPSGDLPTMQPTPPQPVIKLPNIPDQYLRALVTALTSGECTNKTFQYTLQILQQLSALDQNRQIISQDLTDAAQSLADSMLGDLTDLAQILSRSSSATEIQPQTLSKFSLASSQQARFLRVLKALDFLYSKSVAPKIADTTKTADKAESTQSKQEGPVSTASEAKAAEDLATVVNRLKVADLWKTLGESLTVINKNTDLMHIATILLPLIETFMVVSKPFVTSQNTQQSPSAAPNTSSTNTPAPLQRGASNLRSFKDFKDLDHEEIFLTFTEEHRKILNTMVRNNPTLMSGSFSLLVNNPKVLEFDNKRTYFNQQLHKRSLRDQFDSIQLHVRRQYVFDDSYHQLLGRTGNELKYGKLSVHFYEEEGVDAGGVTREWFTVLARQMFNPNYALFKPSAADKVTYQPNRSSWINPDHLSYFKFVGRIIGKAIFDGRLLDCYFTRSFYKCIGNIPVDWRDMEAIDPEFHKSLEWILNNDITDILDLNFTVETDDFGTKKIVELKPDGSNIPVTEQNKHEYVKLITEQKLITAIRDQIDAFLTGFYEIIPKDLVKIFNEQELELLISGMPDIDIDDWKNNTELQNYSSSSPQLQWFWRAVRSFSQEERAKLIQFVTGTSKIPLEGFSHLQGSGGVQKFQIHKDFSDTNRLPSAHTCFNQLDLPQYESYEQLRSSLLTAISECGTVHLMDLTPVTLNSCHRNIMSLVLYLRQNASKAKKIRVCNSWSALSLQTRSLVSNRKFVNKFTTISNFNYSTHISVPRTPLNLDPNNINSTSRTPLFTKILIANRGEIACRIIKTCKKLGIKTVAIYSDEDKNSLHVNLAEEAYRVGPAPSAESYLQMSKIIEIAKFTGAQGIHPGYGFLSENAEFAELVSNSGIAFIGPPASAIVSMGSKSESKIIMTAAGVNVVPGYHGEDQSIQKLEAEAEKIGYPVLIKAIKGGGGKGMRIVEKPEDFAMMLESSKREAIKSFGDDQVLVEKYLVKPRHVEVQVFADKTGNAVYLFERDCSVQRRHQKVIEEAPAPNLPKHVREKLGKQAVAAAKAVNYVGAGTVEFILDTTTNEFYFMEMNTRLQVEHPVTELITNTDLVQWQLEVAAGNPLPMMQSELIVDGHAFEARIYAENPQNNFLPDTGVLKYLNTPAASPSVRIETGIRQGDAVSVYYDPMIAKLVVHGRDRASALALLRRKLEEFQVVGLRTNIEFLKRLAGHDAFARGEVETGFIKLYEGDVLKPPGEPQPIVLAQAALATFWNNILKKEDSTFSNDVFSPWNGAIWKRLNHQMVRTMMFIHESKKFAVSLTQIANKIFNIKVTSHSGVETTYDGFEICEESNSNNLVSIYADAKLSSTVIISKRESGEEIHVFMNGVETRFNIPPPEYESLRHQSDAVSDSVKSPMPCKVTQILVKQGENVKQGQALIVLEAMKMEHIIKSPINGTVEKINFAAGALVGQDRVLITFQQK